MRVLVTVLGLLVGSFIVNEARAQTLEKSLLWKVEGESIQTSYLYGTFHLISIDDFVLKDKVTNAFGSSDQIVIELDFNNPNLQAEIMQNASMKDGKILADLYTEEEYAILDQVATATVGYGLENVKTFKPILVSSMLIGILIEGRPVSYELNFVQMANDQSKDLIGLETPQEQLAIFDQIKYEEQAKDLLQLVTDREGVKEIFGDMVADYKNEDITSLYETMTTYMDGENEADLLVHQRNKNWIPRIGELAKEKSCFFGVGAGHLGGDLGVINLLRKAGYTVTSVQ